MIRVFFAEQGSKADLVATIDRMERFGEEVRARLLAQIEGYLAAGGPFAERWHVIGLGSRYLLDYAELNERWARWARTEVSGWSGDLSDAGPGPELLRENVRAHRPSSERNGRVSQARTISP
jgi:PadR family transcriptional regulator AphA